MPSGSGFAIGTITGNMPNTIVYLCRNYNGVNCGSGASMIGGSFVYSYNHHGFHCTTNSTLLLGAAYASYPENNGVDLYAQGMAYVQYDCWGVGYETLQCYPSKNVPGNDEAYIKVINTTP